MLGILQQFSPSKIDRLLSAILYTEKLDKQYNPLKAWKNLFIQTNQFHYQILIKSEKKTNFWMRREAFQF